MPASAPRRPAAALIATAVALLMTGCAHKATPAAGRSSAPVAAPASSAPTSSAAPATASVAGTWSGTWTRVTSPPGSGTYQWVLHQHGDQVTGTLQAGHSACLTKGSLTGHVLGTRVILHAVTPAVGGVGQAHATYHGTLAGGTLAGTAIVTCSAGTGFGTWTMKRQAST
jgi:hypothetical protein